VKTGERTVNFGPRTESRSRAINGEAQKLESTVNFIHKVKECLKASRETRRWVRLVKREARVKEDPTLLFALSEGEELIRIFHSSIESAMHNARAELCRLSSPGGCPSATGG